jgi:hypothetical protein
MDPVSFQSDRLSVTLTHDDDHLMTTVEDLAVGRKFHAVPLLRMEVHDKLHRCMDTLSEYSVDQLEECSDGVHVTVSDRRTGIRAGIWLRLIDGELSVMIPPTEIYEDKNEIHRCFAIDVLPGLLDVGSVVQTAFSVCGSQNAD